MSAVLLLAAAAAAQTPTICADRPSKANGTCTVPVLHWQLEVSAVDWIRSSDGPSGTSVTSIGSATVKLGLGDNSDIEATVSPYVQVRGAGTRASGVGDLLVRYKQRLTNTAGPVQLAVIPFVKLPTARHSVGNGEVEGGVAVPIAMAVGAITATLGPEIDALADADGHGHHFAVTNMVNLSAAVAPRLTISGELWNSANLDPAGTQLLWSADASAAYLASRRLQLDGGANFGLNRATPKIELYAGASVLF